MKIYKIEDGVIIKIREQRSSLDDDLRSINIDFYNDENENSANYDPKGQSIEITVKRKDWQIKQMEWDEQHRETCPTNNLIESLKKKSGLQEEEILRQGSMLKDFLKTNKS